MVRPVLAPPTRVRAAVATCLFAAALSALAALSAPAARADSPAPAAAPADPLQAVKDAILRALALARRGGPPEKAQAGDPPADRFICALTEPDDEVAWPLFKQLSLDAPREPWGEIGMAHVYVRWRLRDQAEKAFARAQLIDPQNPITRVEQAIAARAFGDAGAARSFAEQVLARDPRDARALLLLAQLAEDAGASKEEQKAAYQRALDASSDLYEARLWMAGLAEQSGDKAAALEAVSALAEMNPRDLPTQRKLAALLRAKEDWAGAEQAFAAAVALGDASKETWSGLAACRRALGDTAGEEQALRRWHRIDPKDRTVIVRLFNLRAAAHDEPGMDEQVRSLLALDSKDAGAHLILATRKGAAGDLLGQLDELNAAASGNVHPEAKGAPERARAELAQLRVRLRLPERPLLAANPDGLYRVSSRHLTMLYEERRKANPELRGNLAVQLKISANGNADLVEVTEDTLHDRELTQCLVAALREGEWPKAKKTLTLRYELAPPGTHTIAASDNDQPLKRPPRARKPAAPAPAPDAPPARATSAADLAGPSR